MAAGAVMDARRRRSGQVTHVTKRNRRERRQGDQRGAGTALVAAVVLVLMVVAAGLVVLSGYVAAIHHARAAADLVALSAASSRARGQDACRAAARVATSNGVDIAECRTRGDSLDFVVTVTVTERVGAPVAMLPQRLTASAVAGRLGLLR